MARRTDFTKALTYTGQKFKGVVGVTLKIDGVRILYRDGELVTRNNKVPPGLYKACTDGAIAKLKAYGDCEIYLGSFVESNSPLQRHEPEVGCITEEHIYPLVELDERLIVGGCEGDPKQIARFLDWAIEFGYEGLVLRANDRWYRVKPTSTADVFITGWFEQKDKHGELKGVLGGFTTNYGRVTAFTDEMRKKLWVEPEQYVGRLMEVQYKELYDSGSFRYAVKFLHFRDDKDTESFDVVKHEKGE
jgi:hypothetical protein